ncbi:carboxypeptidase-like regulatory domain-containing protein [Chloroflexota bacterium]
MCAKWKIIAGFIFTLTLCLALPLPAYAHGAKIEYTVGMTVEIFAAYNSGEPMAGAQVTVYAPNDPSTPWLTSFCDDEGRFSFTPDTAMTGTWDIQVRQAGHGDIIHIPIGTASAGTSSGGSTPLQIVLMAVCVVWGSIGTALYFSRRKA